jgi:hypothetical protein
VDALTTQWGVRSSRVTTLAPAARTPMSVETNKEDSPVPPLAIPTTLHASLMARLDRLAPIREVAQIGAAIGREFSYELLAALVPLPESALQEAVDRLVHPELVFRRGRPPGATYTFKHALIRDAAYATLLRSRRQELHARIAKVLEDRFPETVELHPEILAHHWSQAGLVEKAALYAGKTWLHADGYQRRKQRLGDWEIGVSSYKLGNRYRCEVDNVSPGTRLARGEGPHPGGGGSAGPERSAQVVG